MVDTATLLGYQLRLPSFEGPLDVLLRLVERSQLAITDVSLVAVTDQFLGYVGSLEQADPTLVAEFAAVGARLVLLKSRSLLPRPPVSDEELPPGDLARELIEYRAVKQAALRLAERDRAGLGMFARSDRGIAVPLDAAPLKLASHEASALARAVRRRLAVVPGPRELFAAPRMISLREMAERLLSLLDGRRGVTFTQYARGFDNPSDVRAAFLALLVLIRRRVIDAIQPEPFGEITVVPGAASPATAGTSSWEE